MKYSFLVSVFLMFSASWYSNDTCLIKAYRRAIRDTTKNFHPLIALDIRTDGKLVKGIVHSTDLWSLYRNNKIGWAYYQEHMLDMLINKKELDVDSFVVSHLPFYECVFTKTAIKENAKGKSNLLNRFKKLTDGSSMYRLIAQLTDYIYFLWQYGIITGTEEETTASLYFDPNCR